MALLFKRYACCPNDVLSYLFLLPYERSPAAFPLASQVFVLFPSPFVVMDGRLSYRVSLYPALSCRLAIALSLYPTDRGKHERLIFSSWARGKGEGVRHLPCV